jgi:hypothetical protein
MMRSLPLIALLLLSPAFASAQAISYTVDLNESSPLFARPGREQLSFPYAAIPITVNDGQNFYMIASSGSHPDAYMYVYSTFDPLLPNEGVILSDDDSGEGLLPAIFGRPLTNGRYVAVISSYNALTYGTLTFDIFGLTLDLGPAVSDLADDLSLQYGQYIGVSSAARGRAIAVAARDGNGQSRISASTKGDDLSLGSNTRKGWVTFTRQGIGGEVSGQFSQLHVGVDQELQTGGLAGVSLAYDKISTRTASTSAAGSSFTLQPYLAIRSGEVDAVFSLAYGVTDYSKYTSDSSTGTAKAREVEVSANFSRSFSLAGGTSVRPYVDLAVGRATMKFGGDLADASDKSFNIGRAAIGIEMTQQLSAAGLLAGSNISGRMELARSSNSGPDASFAVTEPVSPRNTATLALGGLFVTSDNSSMRIEATASGIGSGDVKAGVSGSLSIKF